MTERTPSRTRPEWPGCGPHISWWTKPGNLTIAAIDFETEALLDGLLRGGVTLGTPTFVSWRGVSVYLTREAVDTVFHAVSVFPASSRPSEQVRSRRIQVLDIRQ